MGKVIFGGVPTDVDINAIREKYPDADLRVGKKIPYEEVENIVGKDRKSNRYKTVTSRWRKLVEKESGIVIGTVPGKAFKVLNSPEILDVSTAKLRSAVKYARRGYGVSLFADRDQLTGQQQKRLDFSQSRSAAIMAAGQIRTLKKLK